MITRCLARLLVASAAFVWLQFSDAAVITVTNNADSGAGSFRQAIADAQENDTIHFAPDVRGTIGLTSGELLISKALAIQAGANSLPLTAATRRASFALMLAGEQSLSWGSSSPAGEHIQGSPLRVVEFGTTRNVGDAQIINSIVAENTSAGGGWPDAGGSFESNGFNLIGRSEGSSGFTAMGDQTGAIVAPLNPKLGRLQDNGGPTWTRALLPGSPATDAGVSANLATDQRGGVRTNDYPDIPNPPGGDGTDVGSFEVAVPVVRLANISTRLHIGSGDNATIGGFIITGIEPKTVIVRGVGPSLPVPGVLTDPVIEVHGSAGDLLATNDNWRDGEFHTQVANTLPPSNDLESALWGTINPGAYTVVFRGKSDATGIGLLKCTIWIQRSILNWPISRREVSSRLAMAQWSAAPLLQEAPRRECSSGDWPQPGEFRCLQCVARSNVRTP